MLRRSTGRSLETKRVGASIGTATREGCVKWRYVACARGTSGTLGEVSAVVVGMMAPPDAMDCRSSRRGSESEPPIFHQLAKVRGVLCSSSWQRYNLWLRGCQGGELSGVVPTFDRW